MHDRKKYGLGALILGVLAAIGLRSSSASAARRRPRSAGVWLTSSALSEPDRTADEVAEIGFSFANIMLNDYSNARSPKTFDTHDPDRVVRLAAALRASGVGVDLTTWVMPHEKFILGMGKQIPQLARACSARRVWLDAEEPYNQATGSIDYKLAAGEIEDALGTAPPLVLSAISYANRSKLQPLAEVCPYWSPQAYATTRKGSPNPSNIVDLSFARWRARFGEPSRGWIMGLAAYEQPKKPGSMLGPPLDQALDLGIEDVCYWAFGAIRKQPAVRDYLRSRIRG